MLNKVTLMGRLTKDPETRYTSTNNKCVCSFTLAVNRRFSKPGEEKQADFIPIVAWEKTAEFCSKYFTKGIQVVVCGRMQNRTWDDNDGKKHYITEVIADETYFADTKKGEGSDTRNQGTIESNQNDNFFTVVNDDELPF